MGFGILGHLRRAAPWATLAGGLILAACGGTTNVSGPVAQRPAQPQAPAAPQPGEGGRVDLAGPARVALLLPMTASDAGAAAAARDLADAARLAAQEGAGGDIQLDVRDTGGTAAGAAAAAQAAVSAGDALILGPLYGANADAVGKAVYPVGLNVIAFSNTPSAAGGNVWVAGVLADSEAEAILDYAAQNGWYSVGMFYPDTDFGHVAREAAQKAARQAGVRLDPIVSYPRSFEGIQAASRDYADAHEAAGAQTALLADTGQGLAAAASFLRYHYVGTGDAPLLGLGGARGMGDPAQARESSLKGARYAAPDPYRLAEFSMRFQAAYGRTPGPIAWLGYDAVEAAGQMLRAGRARGDDHPFGLSDITDPGGFTGAAGSWRLTSDGLNQRRLEILTPGQTVDPEMLATDPAAGPAAGPGSQPGGPAPASQTPAGPAPVTAAAAPSA